MSKKHVAGGLGRGLGALFGENSPLDVPTAAAVQEAQETDIDLIVPNPYQPRKNFAEDGLEELARSIAQHGVVEPLIARPQGDGYQLVAGERRLRAAKLAGLKKVIVRQYTDNQAREIALVENINRHDLNPIEEAEGLRALMEECGLTQEQAAEKVGRSRVAVTNILRLLNLCKPVQELLAQGKLNMGQARALLGLSAQLQVKVAESVLEKGWSTRMTEEVAQRLKEGKKIKVYEKIVEQVIEKPKGRQQGGTQLPADFGREVEGIARRWLGTKVKVLPLSTDKRGRQAGTIQIEYYSPEDLQRIFELLQGGAPQEGEQGKENKLVKLSV